MDYIWSEQCGIGHLVECLPEDLWMVSAHNVLVRLVLVLTFNYWSNPFRMSGHRVDPSRSMIGTGSTTTLGVFGPSMLSP